jgi:nitrous oxide reductase accessory protein NosL
MRWLIVAACLFTLGCSSVQPLKIAAGERCFRCGRTIEDVRLAGEVIDKRGHALKFRTAGCMAKYLASQPPDTEWRGIWVTDYETGKFVKASKATYARVLVDRNTNERAFAAFSSEKAAAAMAREQGGTTIEWASVLATGQS